MLSITILTFFFFLLWNRKYILKKVVNQNILTIECPNNVSKYILYLYPTVHIKISLFLSVHNFGRLPSYSD